MQANLSIIIPSLNAGGALPAMLDTLLPGVAAGIVREVVLSDGNSADATLQIADDAGCEIVTGAPGRGGQLARGAHVARAEWLLFLHADTHLPTHWVGAVSQHIQSSEDAAVFQLSFRARGIMPGLVAGWANLRTVWFGLPYGDQGLLISRALYDQVGGFEPLPLMEDVAMARRLRGRIKLLPEAVSTDAVRYQKSGWLRRGTRNLWTLARYLGGADPTKLGRAYHKS
ncbi:MAG: TIGR04283 family arsenosugar biosynthesis glycosyltransferase [Pseudomonadota bacterium]